MQSHTSLYTNMCRGTLGIDEMEVSSGCRLMFGRRAQIAGQGWISTEGVLRVPTLTVADGGEVTVTPGLTDEENILTLEVSRYTSFGKAQVCSTPSLKTVHNVVNVAYNCTLV